MRVSFEDGDKFYDSVEEVIELVKPQDEALEMRITGDDRFPCLAVCINRDVASVSYLESEFGMMYVACPKGTLEEPSDDEWLSDINAVISIENLKTSLREFADTNAKPTNVDWQEL